MFLARLVPATLLAGAAAPTQVYGVRHCGDDSRTWSTVRPMTPLRQS
ncbi:hypothetical protein [Streptomyces litmocidini]